jgi:hypothetical protein
MIMVRLAGQLGVNLPTHVHVIGKQAKKIHASGVKHSCLCRPSSVNFSPNSPSHNTSCRAISSLFVLHIDLYQYHFIETIVIFTKTAAFVDYCSLGKQSHHHTIIDAVQLSRARYPPSAASITPSRTPNGIAMARRRSPSISFEPTPAIIDNPETTDRTTKEVHFSPVDPILRRTQSVATAVPLLEPVPSASHLPRHNYNVNGTNSSNDMESYIQQSRAVLQTQRLNFERERKVFEDERKLFEEERKLWSTERALLKAKIVDLEAIVNRSKSEKRKYSNESTKSSTQSFRSDLGRPSFNSGSGSRAPSMSHASPPIWEGPENMARASRVFSEPNTLITNPFSEDQIKHTNGHLPSISESGSFPALEKEMSPSSLPPERAMSVPISIDKIDKSLDGITLKSTALAPSFVATVRTPDAITPQRSRSPNSKSAVGGGMRVGIDGLLSPLDEKLKLHAGHTPMAFDAEGSTGPTSNHSTEIPTPIQEKPPAPVSTAYRPPPRPSEKSGSYFSFSADDAQEPKTKHEGEDNQTLKSNYENDEKENEDPELTGPLVLSSDNDHGQSNAFLSTLDAKLMMEAKKYIKSPDSNQSDRKDQSNTPGSTQDDEGPKIRMKKSTNFGSAFGSNRCGNI